MPAVSLNQAGAGVDELSQCFPSLDTFCPAPIPISCTTSPLPVLLLSLCWAVLSHQAGVTSEPALGGSLVSGKVLQWSQVCDG